MVSGEAHSNRSIPRVLNPLWIISLFLGVSETTVGIAATQINGWIQGLLAVYATLFPLLVSGAFFAIVWKKPEVLYAPGDFPEHVPVPEFVHGMHRGAAGDLDLISSVLRDTLESVLPAVLTPEISEGDVETVVNKAVSTAQTDLESRAIRIDLRLIASDLGQIEWLINSSTTVSEMLDSLWSELRDHFPPFTYNAKWVLVDRQSLESFDEMGNRWAEAHGLSRDGRLLSDVGINPGAELVAVRTAPDRPGWRGGWSAARATHGGTQVPQPGAMRRIREGADAASEMKHAARNAVESRDF